MKVLFLDIDGVVNCMTTRQLHRGFIGIDPRLALIVENIVRAVPGLKVVLSSSWRCLEDGRALVEKKVVPCFDITPLFDEEDDVRGYEIQAWLGVQSSETKKHQRRKRLRRTKAPNEGRVAWIGQSFGQSCSPGRRSSSCSQHLHSS